MKRLLLIITFCTLCISGFAQCYCTVAWYYRTNCSYPIVSISSAAQHLLLVGASGTINDSTACDSSGYLDHTYMSCTLNSGNSYMITVGSPASYSTSYQVWVDFNSNTTFESSECVGGDSARAGSSSRAFRISIPSGSSYGIKRIRIENEYNYHAYPNLSPCPTGSSASSYYYGAVRDYSVIIDSAGSGSVTSLSVSPSSLSFPSSSSGTVSSPILSVFNGSYLTPSSGSLTVSASPNYSVCSTAGGTYTNSYTIAYTGGSVSSSSIYVRFTSPSMPGTYPGNVCITGCGLSSSVCIGTTAYVSSTLNILQAALQEDVLIYPNPATDELTITATMPIENVIITDLIGRQIILSDADILGKGSATNVVNLRHLQLGNYFIKLNDRYTQRFIKE